MRKDTLFSVLSRAPWWISIAAAAVSFAIVRQFLPDIAAIFATLPFIGIAFYAGWQQLRTQSVSNPDEIIAKMRGMSWENFSALIAEAFRRDGYRVIEIFKGAVDLQVDKKGRVAIVS